MADVIEQVADAIGRVFGTGQRAVISDAPGGGPEVNREGERKVLGMNHPHIPRGAIGSIIPKGTDTTGYGGYGDPLYLDEQNDAAIQNEIDQHLVVLKNARLRDVRPTGRFRLSKPFSPEGHTDVSWNLVAGPYSLFDGTTGAPSAGNSIQVVPITLPANSLSPVILLDRYPGALYMSIFVRSFAFMPTGSAMTGIQEVWFTDYGGAVVGLGIFNPANVAADTFQNINALCSTPMTDPGNVTIGSLFINNIGIGGTPVGTRYQLNVSYVALYPDPAFNEMAIVPPTPAEVIEGLRSMEASG